MSFFSSISNAFTPGSPDCVFSTKTTVNLHIVTAFVKAAAASIFPVLTRGTKPTLSDGKLMQYRGSFDRKTGKPYGRGLLYEGSLRSPTTLRLGLFKEGRFQKGVTYQKDENVSFFGAAKGGLLVGSFVSANGEFARGSFLISTGKPQQEQVGSFQLEQKGSLLIPFLGGEMKGISEGVFFDGTFNLDGTFKGKIIDSLGYCAEGVFSIQKEGEKFNIQQLSGTRRIETQMPDGGRIEEEQVFREECIEVKRSFPNGSFTLQKFRKDPNSHAAKLVSETFKRIVSEDGIFEGSMTQEGKLQGRITYSSGDFKEGSFEEVDLGEGNRSVKQISGTLKETYGDAVFEGSCLEGGRFKGRLSLSDGSYKEGVLERRRTPGAVQFNLLSGNYKNYSRGVTAVGMIDEKEGTEETTHTFPNGVIVQQSTSPLGSSLSAEKKYADGSVFRVKNANIELFGRQIFKGSLSFPNGDYQRGQFYADLMLETLPEFLSGEERKALPDGSILEGEVEQSGLFRGMKRKLDGSSEYVIV